jgi:hypothetical protein
MNEQKPLEPWQWPEEHWRKLVNQVRAGRALRPKQWKNGARCAFAISFDSPFASGPRASTTLRRSAVSERVG